MSTGLFIAGEGDRTVMGNLMQLYLHDFSSFAASPDLQIREDGTFDYPYLEHYWSDPDRHPFLIRSDRNLAGFALVRRERDPESGQPVTDLAEFFVLRGFRRRHIGTEAAMMLWDRFPGHWQVRVMSENRVACQFWKPLIETHTGGAFTETEEYLAGTAMRRFNFSGGVSGNRF